ncbi:MAG: DEAD/DEAH box helicase [Alphaproteobacteria bacterium]|nr:MAG: DEAD/DEAH box helicase [Alphaproteobacteria bacterium]
MNFTTPTPIQAQAIPPALTGRDVLGSAQTGTGKTAAFAIPLIAKLLKDPQGTALVMTPTRELAAQVVAMIDQLLTASPGIRTALLIGGQSMFKQLQQLRQRPRIIVGTPGRINDHLQQNSLNLSMASFLVLDETDRMLDMGFGPQIDRIVKRLPAVRQTLMFSATLPAHIVKISQQYLKNPERIAVGETNQPIRAIKQELIRVNVADKYNMLMTQLRSREGSVIVFVRTKRGADRLAKKLNGEKQSADSIHGNLNQNQRNRVIQAFRDKKHRIMVATDVAARGLDIPHIEHVINYDLPQVAEDYIHRIGRTARAGAEGSAVCFITPEDGELWGAIHELLNPGAPRTRPVSHSGKPVGRPYAQKHNRSGFRDRKARDERNGGHGRDDRNGQNGQRSHGRSDDRSNDRKSDRTGDRFGGRFENRSNNRPENRSGRQEYGQRRTARA